MTEAVLTDKEVIERLRQGADILGQYYDGGAGFIQTCREAAALLSIKDEDILKLKRRVVVLERVIAEEIDLFHVSDELNIMIVADVLRAAEMKS